MLIGGDGWPVMFATVALLLKPALYVAIATDMENIAPHRIKH
jgi:hypothetical protein